MSIVKDGFDLLQVQLPSTLARRIRIKAAKDRLSIADTVTDLCRTALVVERKDRGSQGFMTKAAAGRRGALARARKRDAEAERAAKPRRRSRRADAAAANAAKENAQ